MSFRECLGLLLLVVALSTAPLAYFVGHPWGWVALCAAVVGAPLFITERVSRRHRKDESLGPDFGAELQGFQGRRIFRNVDDSLDGD